MSILSPIGNIIFAPIFLVFILVSGLIFFSEILNIPNGLLVYILNKTTDWWAYFLSFGSDSFLWGAVQPPIIFSILVIFGTFFVLINKTLFKTKLHKIGGFVAIFTLGFLFLYFYKTTKLIKDIKCGSKTVQIINFKNQTTLIFNDPVFSRLSCSSWVSFKLIPELIKNTGSFKIDNLVIFYPTQLTLNIAKFISQNFNLKNLYILALKDGQISSLTPTLKLRRAGDTFSLGLPGVALAKPGDERGDSTIAPALKVNLKSLNIVIIDENQQELDLGSFKLKLVKKGFISKRSLSSSQISSEPVTLSQLQV